MDLLFSVLGKALVPFAVLTAFAVARRYLPAKSYPVTITASQQDLSARFQRKAWPVGTAMVLVGIVFAWSVHAILVRLNQYSSTSHSAEGFRLWPQPAIWWFLPGFGAVALAWEITLQLWSEFGNREEAALYNYWSCQRAGFDCTKVLRWMGVVIVLPIAILTVLAISMHSTLGSDEIVDCGYAFSPCQRYRYADAHRMAQIDGYRDRNGDLNYRAGIVLEFKDGSRWSSAEWGDFSKSVDPALIELLKAKTGLQLEYATTEADIRRRQGPQ